MCLASLVRAEAVFPVLDGQVHNGVATCAGSMCHGAVKKHKQTDIQHNEYILWDRRDAHSRAYSKLFNEDFKAITRKLGLKEPYEEPVCLACHASNVPESLRGSKFLMSDGIGCETCHGGSEKWLKSHTNKNASHQDNLEKGLYPTDDIVERARLCLSCHYGNKHQFVTHEIMGAGHPRISFELDTFTELQPRHFTQDEDYAERKQIISNVKAWSVGQAVAVQSMLEMITSDQFHAAGLFPELSLFDCHSCHHPMSAKSWRPRKGTQLKPGAVPLNDASLRMLRHVLTEIDGGTGWRFKKSIQALHTASANDPVEFYRLANEMLAQMPNYIDRVVQHEFDLIDIKKLTKGILDEGIWEGFNDYVVAEQSVMALAMLVINWDIKQPFEDALQVTVNNEINKLYDLVEDDEAYNFDRFRTSLIELRKTLFSE